MIPDNDYYSGFVFDELISLSSTSDAVSRNVYDIFGVFGDIGGIISVFTAMSAFLIGPYAELCFQIRALLTLFEVKQRDKILKM